MTLGELINVMLKGDEILINDKISMEIFNGHIYDIPVSYLNEEIVQILNHPTLGMTVQLGIYKPL